jgi:HYR domain
VPSAGSLFAIGDTTVECVATDAGGNTASRSFVVTVLGANEQIAQLIGDVIDATSLPAAVKSKLIATLRSLTAGFNPTKPAAAQGSVSHAERVHRRRPVRGPARASGRMDRRGKPHQDGARLLSRFDLTPATLCQGHAGAPRRSRSHRPSLWPAE